MALIGINSQRSFLKYDTCIQELAGLMMSVCIHSNTLFKEAVQIPFEKFLLAFIYFVILQYEFRGCSKQRCFYLLTIGEHFKPIKPLIRKTRGRWRHSTKEMPNKVNQRC